MKTMVMAACLLIAACGSPGTVYINEPDGTNPSETEACTDLEGSVVILNTLDWDALVSSGCTTITGDLQVGEALGGAPLLVHLSGTEPAEHVMGWVAVLGTGLSDLSWLAKLTTVDGGLSITKNEKLTNLSGLTNLTHVEGDISIYGNLSLPQCQVDALLARLRANGWSGNSGMTGNGTGTCP